MRYDNFTTAVQFFEEERFSLSIGMLKSPFVVYLSCFLVRFNVPFFSPYCIGYYKLFMKKFKAGFNNFLLETTALFSVGITWEWFIIYWSISKISAMHLVLPWRLLLLQCKLCWLTLKFSKLIPCVEFNFPYVINLTFTLLKWLDFLRGIVLKVLSIQTSISTN